MDRKQNWYSIIQFMPNNLRGEIINVGVLLHQPEDGSLKYKLLDERNPKIKSLLSNDVSVSIYKVNKDVIEHYLKNVSDFDTMFEAGIYNDSFLNSLSEYLPDGFTLSEPSFALSNNPDNLFKQLMINYIGKEFIYVDEKPAEVSTKRHLRDFFSKQNLLGTKVKPNVNLNPIKDLKGMLYQIDFVYKNGVINLIHTAPNTEEQLNNWFSRINTFSANYNSDSDIFLIYENNSLKKTDNTLIDMLSFLRNNDERIHTIDFKSKDMMTLSNNIQNEGKYVEEFEKELA